MVSFLVLSGGACAGRTSNARRCGWWISSNMSIVDEFAKFMRSGPRIMSVDDVLASAEANRRQRSHRRALRRMPAAAVERALWAAAAAGDGTGMSEALAELENNELPCGLLHECARNGHVACVQLLLEHASCRSQSVLAERSQGVTPLEAARAAAQLSVVEILENELRRQYDETAAALLARQSEACGLAHEAQTVQEAAASAAALALEISQNSAPRHRTPRAPSARASAGDRACHLACEFLAQYGDATFERECAESAAWLQTGGARELMADLAESVPGHGPTSASGTELALAVRVVQLRLREAASAALARPLGQDDLAPLLEQVLIFSRPRAAQSVALKLQAIEEELLLRKPDLASAVDGWTLACEGVKARAVGAWRAALRAETFWRALGRSPAPNVLLMSTYPEKRNEPLATVFHSFLEHLASDESEAWPSAASLEAHARTVQCLVDDLLPTEPERELL